MTNEEIYEALNEVFRDVFDDDSIVVKPETTAADIEDWDSLTHITLVVSIEKRFGVKFSMGEVAHFKNVGEMVDVLVTRIS